MSVLRVRAHCALPGATSSNLHGRSHLRQPVPPASGRFLRRIKAQEGDQQASASEASPSPPAPKPPAPQAEEPSWVRRERERELMKNEAPELPFGVYLLSAAMVAIAAVGSIFEYTAKNPIFGVVEADSPLYAPILGVFAITGFPMAAFLFYKAVATANKASERMDKLDGY